MYYRCRLLDARTVCLREAGHNTAGLGPASVAERRSAASGNLQCVQANVRVPGKQLLFVFPFTCRLIPPTPQVPPFNNQANVQFVSSDIAILLHDWVTEALRPQSTLPKQEFPVGLVDSTVDTYIKELLPSNKWTLELYTAVKGLIRQNW
jgi:hypothetical protein